MCVLFLSRRVRILPRGMLTQGFQNLCGVLKTSLIAATLSLPCTLSVQAFGLRPTEMTINDPWTGAAIDGYDPVAYFLDRQAVAGSTEHQIIHSGLVWKFVNEGNRAAFEDNPDAYLPAFGGYDPVGIAAGLPVAGLPRHFLIVEGRVHLFRTAENRALFIARKELLADAQRNWPEVRRLLAP